MTSPSILEQLKATGVAQVIVAIKPPAAAASREADFSLAAPTPESLDAVAARLATCFVQSELSQPAALARSSARRIGRLGMTKAMTDLPGAALALESSAPAVRMFEHLGLMYGTVDREGLARLKASADVDGLAGAPPLRLIRPVARLDVKPRERLTWGLRRLRIPDAWAAGYTGKGVLVGHLDTGYDAKHPGLKTALAAFAEFDALGYAIPNAKPRDTDVHGTHTAGTIAGRKVGDFSFGVAPGAKIASGLVIEGGDVIARVLAGMNWVVSLKARVLSLSLGLPGYREDFLLVVRALRARQVLPVIAVGNEGPGTSRYPGNYSESLSVGAMGLDERVAPFSSGQRFRRTRDPAVPDIVGPGVDVDSCSPGGGFIRLSGTSMATPHVAGLTALLFEAKPTATVAEVERAIYKSCERPETMSAERANRGVPDAIRALEALLGEVPTPPKPAPPKSTAKKSAPRKKPRAKA